MTEMTVGKSKKQKRKRSEKAGHTDIDTSSDGGGRQIDSDKENATEIKAKAKKPKLADEHVGNSNVRSSKARMMADCSYIEKIMSLVRIPSHNLILDEDESEDDEVNEVPADVKRKMNINTDRATTHQELRERLHRKMAELKANNEITNEDRHKRKLKKKMKKVDLKKQEKDNLKQKIMKVGKAAGNMNKFMKDTLKKTDHVTPVKSGGKLIFSKFDFSSTEVSSPDIKKKHLDPKAALAKIAKQKEKLESMKEKGLTDKVKRIEDKTVWQAAIDKAEGVKIKDDVELLKKSLKKQEQRKKSSKKKWEQRVDAVHKKKEGLQTKRKENLQKRKKDVKDGKKKKAIKKGRLIPGV